MYEVRRNAISQKFLEICRYSLFNFADRQGGMWLYDLDSSYRNLSQLDKSRLYNAAKRMPCMYRDLWNHLPSESLLIDLNFRIDGRDNLYAFNWHQDYWFSMCSRKAVVQWIPLTDVTPDMGGLEFAIGGAARKWKTRPGPYTSYSDAILLDEPMDLPTEKITDIRAGDCVEFTFDELHRSLPNTSEKWRWTLQIRWCRWNDEEFMLADYKPGIVKRGEVTFLEKQK